MFVLSLSLSTSLLYFMHFPSFVRYTFLLIHGYNTGLTKSPFPISIAFTSSFPVKSGQNKIILPHSNLFSVRSSGSDHIHRNLLHTLFHSSGITIHPIQMFRLEHIRPLHILVSSPYPALSTHASVPLTSRTGYLQNH